MLAQMRKMVHSLLNQNVAKKYVPYQLLENRQMLHDLLDTPNDFLEHIRRYSNALTTTMVFGWRTPTYSDRKMQQLFDGFSEFAEINQTGTAALIDFFPLLRWLPDWALPVRRKARALHHEEKRLYLSHWLKAKKNIQDGTLSHCFCVGMAQAQANDGFSDDQAVSLNMSISGARSCFDSSYFTVESDHSAEGTCVDFSECKLEENRSPTCTASSSCPLVIEKRGLTA